MTMTERRALVVDDVTSNRKLAVAFLARLGWKSIDVDGGIAALECLSAEPAIDLVLLDISMPDMCGETVCRQLRADPRFAALPIVAYTAHALPADTERFLASGFDAVLIKPISAQDLQRIITEIFPA